jgi:hypothetical protein
MICIDMGSRVEEAVLVDVRYPKEKMDKSLGKRLIYKVV